MLSDFLDLDAAFWKSIDLFRRSRFDVMLFHIAHPEELDLPDVATARFLEAEGPGRFNSEPATIRQLYRQRFEAHLREIQGNCQARGCDWFLARTSDNACQFLRNSFLAREHRR